MRRCRRARRAARRRWNVRRAPTQRLKERAGKSTERRYYDSLHLPFVAVMNLEDHHDKQSDDENTKDEQVATWRRYGVKE